MSKSEKNFYRGPVRKPVDFSKHLVIKEEPMLTRAQFEYEYMSNPHPQLYWGPDETWDEAVAREIDYRYACYKKAFEQY